MVCSMLSSYKLQASMVLRILYHEILLPLMSNDHRVVLPLMDRHCHPKKFFFNFNNTYLIKEFGGTCELKLNSKSMKMNEPTKKQITASK